VLANSCITGGRIWGPGQQQSRLFWPADCRFFGAQPQTAILGRRLPLCNGTNFAKSYILRKLLILCGRRLTLPFERRVT